MASMDSAEFSEWQAYYSLEPFGSEYQNLLAAIPAMTTANCTPGRKGRALNISDFMLKRGSNAKGNAGGPDNDNMVRGAKNMRKLFRMFANTHNKAVGSGNTKIN